MKQIFYMIIKLLEEIKWFKNLQQKILNIIIIHVIPLY